MNDLPELKPTAFPIVVSGPSGVGKTVLCRGLLDRLDWTRRSISATTRDLREGEIDGRSYFFYSRDRFLRELEAGGMAESAEVHGQLYGTPRPFLDQQLGRGFSVVLNIDVQGGASIRRVYPDAVLIFVLPPSFEELEARLRHRATDSEKEIERRLETARREILRIGEYDYVVINDQVERAVGELSAIATAERARVGRRIDRVRGGSGSGAEPESSSRSER